MSDSGAERTRGNLWAEAERHNGAWVMKLPASSTAGIPDWLHVHPKTGISLVEAKTTEAVRRAGSVLKACSGAQRFILRMVAKYGGNAHVLVLDYEHYTLHDWADVAKGGRLLFTNGRRRYAV